MSDSKPPKPPEPREPTLDELLKFTHEENRQHWKRGGSTDPEFLESLKAEWRAAQEPIAPPSEPKPPERESDDKTPVHKFPLHPTTLSKEQARRERITRAYQSGQRPDPEDLAEEEADEIRYRREVEEARQRKIKEVFARKPQPPDDTSEKAKPGAKEDPKPKRGTQPYEFPERWAGVTSPKAPPIDTGRPPTPKASNAGGYLALAFALLERGLDVIGYQNLIVGGLLFAGAFIAFVAWFLGLERAARWRFRWRAVIILVAALAYFSFFGYQLYKQYKSESPMKTSQVSNPTATPTLLPSVSTSPQLAANTSTSPAITPAPQLSNTTAATVSPTPTESPNVALPSDTKIGLLQCTANVYDEEIGYRTLEGAICIAKHQQSGQEFIGTTDQNGLANINLPYGFYVVTIKAEGYVTLVEAAKVDEQSTHVVVLLQKVQ